jgi:hypothetical protein
VKRCNILTGIALTALGIGLPGLAARNAARLQPSGQPFPQVAALAQSPQRAQAPATAPVDLASFPYVRNLSEAAKRKLSRDAFVVSGRSPSADICSFYGSLKQDNIPIFVSSDALLHTSHRLFDWSLRFLEAGYLRDDMVNLTDALLREVMAYHDQVKTPPAREAALLAAAYLSTGKRLIGGGDIADIPQPYRSRIEKELGLIQKAQGFSTSPLMGYREDYSQFKPRGHYSRAEGFQRYFRGLVWYGRMTFRISPPAARQPGASLSEQAVQRQALAAAMIASALSSARVKGERAQAVWRRIYETTSYFAGHSDDLTLADCEPARNAAFGRRVPAFDDAAKVAKFIAQVRKLRKPRILSTFAVSGQQPGWQEQTHAVSFMGQRYAPDTLILNRLVFDRVGNWQGRGSAPFTLVNAGGLRVRGLPRGLDVMAGLGSSVALDVLRKEGDTAYHNYDSRLAEVRKLIAGLKPADWSDSLYMLRLAAVKDVLSSQPRAIPFMRSPAWSAKELQAGLGAWTELKHDTILYSRQSYSAAQSAMAVMGKGGVPPPKPRPTRGFVEPEPAVYGRLAAAVEGLRHKLDALGYPRDQALDDNLGSFAGLLRSLEIISTKELDGRPLSDSEYDLIWNFGDKVGFHLGFPHHTDISMRFMDPQDRRMPMVADVATDVNSKQVLEEALGWPRVIYVVAPVRGKRVVCEGVVYSYYEFKQPMSNRLTDEEWRQMVWSPKAPARPRWTDAFMAP